MHKLFSLILICCLGLVIGISVLAQSPQESVTVTTYYPSPYAVYKVMKLDPYSVEILEDCPADQEGALAFSRGNNTPLYCNGSKWVAMGSGVTTANITGNIIYKTQNMTAQLSQGGTFDKHNISISCNTTYPELTSCNCFHGDKDGYYMGEEASTFNQWNGSAQVKVGKCTCYWYGYWNRASVLKAAAVCAK